jgi:hypothetical protein
MPEKIKSKTICLSDAVALLVQCSAVVVDDDILVYPTSFEDVNLTCLPNAQTKTEFMRLKWEDEGLGFEQSFEVEKNQAPTISGTSLFLNNSDGEECQFTLLVPQNLEPACAERENLTSSSGECIMPNRLPASVEEMRESLRDLLAQMTGPYQVYGNGCGGDGKKTGLSYSEFNALRDQRIAKAQAILARVDGAQ